MKSVGEVMAIGRTFPEALLKGMRAHELGGDVLPAPASGAELDGLRAGVAEPDADRLRDLFRLLASGDTPASLSRITGIDPWFLHQMRRITEHDEALRAAGSWDRELVRDAKRFGFSDRLIASRLGMSERAVRARRLSEGIAPMMQAVDTCAAEFVAQTPYFYSTYEDETEVPASERPRVMILGSGPNRIGQGLEFDYCCVQAALELKQRGYDVLLVNSNPETVSTDYDVSSRLYFEPLTLEDVLNVVDAERPVGVIVQLGGQTPLKLARGLHEAGVPLWGTPYDGLDVAENRARFRGLLEQLGLRQPESLTATSREQALHCAQSLGYPVLVRPSYVLGGRGMRVAYAPEDLEDWLPREALVSGREPVAARQVPRGARGRRRRVADGETVLVAGVMEHIEEAGIHSGDSTCVIPPFTLGENTVHRIRRSPRGSRVRHRVRADERAVRGAQRADLRARGQPARVTHGAVREQGDGRAARAHRRARDGGRAPGRHRSGGARGRTVRERQEARATVQPVPGRGHPAGPGDEVDRRGHGPRS
jgi:carbamoyl-phosphate synthase large subunit